jgi:2-hydroxychromene-2-carboxylate isomerase
MTAPIDFYFDFSSPYGYLASEKIEALAARHGRTVKWRPVLLGVIFKQTGATPLTMVPLKGDYSKRDMMRSARFHGIADFRIPTKFPIPSQAPARIVLWTERTNPDRVASVVHALYRAFFVDDLDVSSPEIASSVAGKCGVDSGAARAAVDDATFKDALKRANDDAIAAGVFGSPFIVADGEPFWGLDRLEQVDRWLAQGGW